mgnify:CR=1 FL=1
MTGVVVLPCAGCGEPVRLTWTTSIEGHSVFHAGCFERQ